MTFVVVGLGGALGAMLRYSISLYINTVTPDNGFPFGTLAVNMLGCLALGTLSSYVDSHTSFSPQLHMMLTVGIFGALTTFSTFSHETITLFKTGEIMLAGGYMLAQLTLGFLMVWVGFSLGNHIP